MLIPGLPLIQVMFSAQVINGLLLPVILVFVMLLAGDERIMGKLVSGRDQPGARLARDGDARRDVARRWW